MSLVQIADSIKTEEFWEFLHRLQRDSRVFIKITPNIDHLHNWSLYSPEAEFVAITHGATYKYTESYEPFLEAPEPFGQDKGKDYMEAVRWDVMEKLYKIGDYGVFPSYNINVA